MALFVETSMASFTAVMEELSVSVAFIAEIVLRLQANYSASVQNWKKRAFYRYLVNFKTLSFINVLRNFGGL